MPLWLQLRRKQFALLLHCFDDLVIDSAEGDESAGDPDDLADDSVAIPMEEDQDVIVETD